jgi:hypothetical protein
LDKIKMKKIVFFLLISIGAFAQTGIGTTTPVNKFQIEATTANPSSTGSSTNGNLRISGSGASHVLDFGLSSSSTFAWLQARSKSNYATLYDLAFNPNGGKVGIGNSAPSATLTVGNDGGTIGGEILLNPTSTQYEGGQIIFKKSLQGSTVDWTVDQYGTTSANARFRIFNGNSEMNGISILENGNVGLGTANPSAKLNLDGGGIRISTGFGNTTNRPGLNAGSIGNYEIRAVGAGGSGSAQNDGGDDGFLRLSAGGGTSTSAQSSIDISGFSTVADMTNTIAMRTAGTERFRINADGKIGLGTSSPSATFHIQNGNTAGPTDPANNTLPSIYLFNTNSSSTSANSILSLRTSGSGGGSPFLSFDIFGVRGYSMGMDNGDADKFKIIPNWNFTGLSSPILTIDTDNKVGIGTASPARRFHVQSSDFTTVYVESTASDNNGMMILNGNTNQNWSAGWHEFMMFQNQGNTIGQITAPNGSSVSYNTTSDYRLKKDLKPFNGLALINRLKTYDFAWKIDDSRMYGFMAHELQNVLPYIVTGQKDAVDSNGKIIPQTVDYSKLTPILVKAIQEQDETINNLKKDKERLEQTIKDIQDRILKLENKK